MKKTLLCIALAASALCLKAQSPEEILSKIENAPVHKEAITGRLTEVRTPVVKDRKSVTLKGDFLFKDGNFLSIMYDNKDQFIINGTRMTTITAGQSQVFDTSKNLMMKNLSEVLTSSCNGTLKKLSEQQACNIEAVKNGRLYVVTLTAQKKSARGLSKLEVSYNVSDCKVKSLTMYEVTGATTSYTLE